MPVLSLFCPISAAGSSRWTTGLLYRIPVLIEGYPVTRARHMMKDVVLGLRKG